MTRYTKHALTAMQERGIRAEWVEAVLTQPEWTESDASQPGVILAFGRVAEFGNRVLRVVYDRDDLGFCVVTTFFDRNRKEPKR